MQLPGLQNSTEEPTVISGRKLVLLTGLLGFVLPIVLIILSFSLEDCQVVQYSISEYYYTVARNFFVGTLCSLSLCLMAYRGYSDFDNWLSNAAAFLALGVAFFPTSTSANDCIDISVGEGIVSTMHFVSATLLFITFAIFSIFLFTKTNKMISEQKKRENTIYITCGVIIVISIICIFIWKLVDGEDYPNIEKMSPIFWLEALALWAFSASWLTKSKIFSSEE